VCNSFSALQRAENSSISVRALEVVHGAKFQCSSASRKFLNAGRTRATTRALKFQCSSASRKFLNQEQRIMQYYGYKFQCSSASRKFLNETALPVASPTSKFQCSSASRKFLNLKRMIDSYTYKLVEFQCSSASRKFLNPGCCLSINCPCSVSVLFSEPKIPQCNTVAAQAF